MAPRFNPPPGWPQQPAWWQPPPGWQPDPSWPPPPPGWQFWIEDTATQAQTPPSGQPQPWEHPAAGKQPAGHYGRRLLQWFRARPLWAKIVLIVLLLGLLPWLLIAAGLAVMALGLIGLARGSLPRFRITSRPLAVGAVALGLVSFVGGTAFAGAVMQAPPSPPAVTQAPSAALPAPAPAIPVTTQLAPTTVPSRATAPTTTPATAAPVRKPPATHAPTSMPPKTTVQRSLCGAPDNPYGYNFCGRGSHVYRPPAGICSYFACIQNFDNGVGYMEECQDGMYSMSGGRQGACSYHGGELRPVSSGP